MYLSENSRLRLFAVACVSIAGNAIASAAYAACVDPNTCFGSEALKLNPEFNNSAFGFQAMGASFYGNNNTAVGTNALTSNGVTLDPDPFTNGNYLNTAVGSHALNLNKHGGENTAIGAAALLRNTVGSRNVAVGAWTLESNIGGVWNIAVGHRSLSGNVSGSSNIAVGADSLTKNRTGQGNVALGNFVMSLVPNFNSEFDPKHTIFNVAVGHSAMNMAPSGNENSAVGAYALAGNLELGNSGTRNTAMGAFALWSNSTGSFNTANGHQALNSNLTGIRNTATGTNALFANTAGNHNTANGNNALGNTTTGARNVALGHRAGEAITTGSDNIIIGGNNTGVASDSGVIRIGRGANQKRTFIAGICGIKTGLTGASAVLIDANGQLGTIQSSREVKEDIHPMGNVSDRLLALRPVTFRYKEADYDGSKPIQFGLIAEDVAESFPELVVYDANGKPETVSYHLLATLLLNEFQKERGITQTLAGRIAELEQEFARLAEIVGRLNHASIVATAQ